MITKLLNSLLANQLNSLELAPAGPTIDDSYYAYTRCSDGSCRGDCVGGCDGDARGNYGTACSDGSCRGDCVGGCEGTPAGGW